MNLIMTKGHSRIPVYSGSLTNIIGLVLVSVFSLENNQVTIMNLLFGTRKDSYPGHLITYNANYVI